MRKLAVFMLLLFVYVSQARFLEVVYIPGLAAVFAAIACIGAILGGNMPAAIQSRIGLLLIGFTGWAIATVPFSVWPGGSVALLKGLWLKTALLYLMIAATFLTSHDCKRAFYFMASATATLIVLSFRYANMSTGRLSFGSGTLANPNDFASYLLVGAPFCVYALLRAGMFMRVVWTSILAILFLQFVRTGSRGGMVAVAVLVLYLFWKASVTWKAAMLVCLVAAIAAAPVVLPTSVLNRYATMVGAQVEDEDQARQAEYAETSTESRSMLLRMSLEFTARNPIVGVGIGQFSVAVADELKAEGQRGFYLQTHNLYTQVSSETGIPGFLMYVAAIWHAMGCVRTVRKRAAPNSELAKMSYCLQASWILFLCTGFFSSVAYHMQIAFLLGFSHTLRNALAEQPARMAAAVPAVRTRVPVAQPAFR